MQCHYLLLEYTLRYRAFLALRLIMSERKAIATTRAKAATSTKETEAADTPACSAGRYTTGQLRLRPWRWVIGYLSSSDSRSALEGYRLYDGLLLGLVLRRFSFKTSPSNVSARDHPSWENSNWSRGILIRAWTSNLLRSPNGEETLTVALASVIGYSFLRLSTVFSNFDLAKGVSWSPVGRPTM